MEEIPRRLFIPLFGGRVLQVVFTCFGYGDFSLLLGTRCSGAGIDFDFDCI